MADGAVNFLLEKLTIILMQRASLLGEGHGEIDEIRLELESMRSFLRDAERRKERSELVEAWVRQVREVAYEIEDIVDEFLYHKERNGNGAVLKKFVQDIVNLPKNMMARHQISSKLQKLKAKVHEVSERSKRYGFDEISEGRRKRTASNNWRELPVFSDDDEELVGIEENTRVMLEWLEADEPHKNIFSIVGMGGLGKTTLVTQVYEKVKHNFDCWAWISVSQTNEGGELLRSMIKELVEIKQGMIPGNLGSMNYMQLVRILIDYLLPKRYVLVLDDIWSIDLWSQIRGAFPNNRNRSRIILTTRNENVAASVGIGNRIHRLQPLQDADAWALFCKKAFWNDPGHSCPRELEPLARVILKKCEGLPLAIVAVGGLMCSRNKTFVEWKKVYESINWQLSYNPMLEQVKGILLLSFNDLPFYLKHCFLYCSIFPDGHPIKRKKLIRLWVAEGFITERKGMTMEEVADEYLTELILRSMIQVTETNDEGRVKTCRVHDVMRELAMTTSEKENFCTACDGRETSLEGKTHRLSVYNRGEKIKLSGTLSQRLRSFFVFETDVSSLFSLNELLAKFKLLRVLDLQGVSIETLPSSLLGLFNLRYLNLRETKVKKLPEAVERLKNLQTLDVRNTNVKRLPNGVSKLHKLRHLYMYHDNEGSSRTPSLRRSLQAPLGIWNARSLQTLVCVEAEEQLIKEIHNLTELRRLEITNLRAVDGPTLCSSVQKMTSLVQLGVAATDGEELQLAALSLPPFLQKLTLVGRLNALPHWLDSLANLTHLHLDLSQLQQDITSSLNPLSNLVFLQLKKAYDGEVLDFRIGWFPRLKKLNLLELRRLGSVRVEEGALASIQELYLIRCPALKVLPQGIEYLTGLQKLLLEEMPEDFVERLKSDMSEDESKLQHIPTIIMHSWKNKVG